MKPDKCGDCRFHLDHPVHQIRRPDYDCTRFHLLRGAHLPGCEEGKTKRPPRTDKPATLF